MSFLKQVLATAESADIEIIKKEVPSVIDKITTCKENINTYIDNAYRKYSCLPKKNHTLLQHATQLANDIDFMKEHIESIVITNTSNKSKDIDNLSQQLEQSNVALRSALQLMKINQVLTLVKDYQEQYKYIDAAFALIQIDEFIKNIPKDEITDTIKALLYEVNNERGLVTHMMGELFDENVKVVEGKPGNVQTNIIKIRRECKEFSDILHINHSLNIMELSVKKFSNGLWNLICKPIVRNLALVRMEDDDRYHILHLVIKKTSVRNTYIDVFNKLNETFTFLNRYFNYPEAKTVSYIGELIQNDLMEVIIEEYLGNSCPIKEGNVEAFQTLIADTRAFQEKLVDLEILLEENNPIFTHVNNMELQLVNKKCQEYTLAANALMKKGLSDMVEVGVPYNDNTHLTGEKFPECFISKSTIELLNLIEEMLNKALDESEVYAAHLISTVQSIFYQYGSIVYSYHERLLQTIPQQVVLYRNNCMYLADQLSQLNMKYFTKFSEDVVPNPPIFKDQSHQLRTIGGDTFLGFVEAHIKMMENTLLDYKFTPQQLSEPLTIDSDRCLRQCLRQYEILKTVWHKILPHAVYNKTIGYMLHMFCKKLIEAVVNAEDISLKNATQLIDMYKVIILRGPKLFTDPQEISLHVESWRKFEDIIFLLKADMTQIDDRWDNGKGPLTLYFSADEIRHIIKALFQNTDRRATILSKIK